MSPDEQNDFESTLRKLKPSSLDAAFVQRVEDGINGLEQSSKLMKFRSVLSGLGLGMAALLALGVGFSLWSGMWQPLSSDSVPVVDTVTQPVVPLELSPEPQLRAENTLQRRIDEGLVFLANGTAARQYRYQFLDRVVWENPEDGSVMEVEVPREEVFLVPVQTF